MKNLVNKKNKNITVTFANDNQNCSLSFDDEVTCMIGRDGPISLIKEMKERNAEISGDDLQDCLLYRTDKIKLPRNKVELLKDKYNISITRNIDKADYIVTSENKIGSMFTRSDKWSVDNDTFKSLIKKYNHLFRGYEDDLNSIEADVISFRFKNVSFEGWHGKTNLTVAKAAGTLFKKEICNESVTYVYNLYEEDLFNQIIDPNNNIIFDDNVTQAISNISPEVTDEVFQSLLSMVASNDLDNVALALEIMSNSNFDKSLDKIMYIYNFYNDELRQCKNWNSINVKTLRSSADKYLTYGNRYHAAKYTSFINKITSVSVLTKVVAEKVCEDFTNAIMETSGLNGPIGSKMFKISRIKLKETVIVHGVEEVDLPF